MKIGTTSYIYQDTAISNIRKLKGRVGDIEIIAFEAESSQSIPSDEEFSEMADIARRHDMTYTVHLPVDIELGCADEDKRKKSIDVCVKMINAYSILKPFSYILHCNRFDFKQDTQEWLNLLESSVSEIIKRSGVDPKLMAVENLNYDFSVLDGLIDKHRLSCCMDVGHLVVENSSTAEHIRKYSGRIRVIHFHGVDSGKDHVSLKRMDIKAVKDCLDMIKKSGFNGVLTLELFSESDFEESLEIVANG